MQTLNVIDTAIRTGIFQTFMCLLEGSPLERRLRRQESFTLFAPVDISFAYLPPEMFDRLLKAANQGILSDVLGYHVVPRKIMSSVLRDLRNAPTIYGMDLSVDNTSQLRVGGAKVLHLDIVACNGVIHGIDRLLMPLKLAAAASR
ncbi:MAG TPA: fasciclin domain-containing protein [Pyrinomonadaceae bacterium]|nr:fasciclin domain-containing protein [Pyrinomonadaceae bacterium]